MAADDITLRLRVESSQFKAEMRKASSDFKAFSAAANVGLKNVKGIDVMEKQLKTLSSQLAKTAKELGALSKSGGDPAAIARLAAQFKNLQTTYQNLATAQKAGYANFKQYDAAMKATTASAAKAAAEKTKLAAAAKRTNDALNVQKSKLLTDQYKRMAAESKKAGDEKNKLAAAAKKTNDALNVRKSQLLTDQYKRMATESRKAGEEKKKLAADAKRVNDALNVRKSQLLTDQYKRMAAESRKAGEEKKKFAAAADKAGNSTTKTSNGIGKLVSKLLASVAAFQLVKRGLREVMDNTIQYEKAQAANNIIMKAGAREAGDLSDAWKKMASDQDAWARDTATKMNASYLDIITAGNKHTAMLQTNGIEQGRAVQMSRDLITVGIDAAAVLGNQEETHRRMKGVITGETEAIEELGINLKVSALAQQAFKEISEKSELGQLLLSKGISGTTADIAKQIPTMDEATKIQLRHGTAMEQSRIFAGASAEMQDTLGGKVQTLKNRWEKLSTEVGQTGFWQDAVGGALDVGNQFLKTVDETGSLSDAFDDLANNAVKKLQKIGEEFPAFQKKGSKETKLLQQNFEKAFKAMGDDFKVLGKLASTWAKGIGTAISNIWDAAKLTWPKITAGAEAMFHLIAGGLEGLWGVFQMVWSAIQAMIDVVWGAIKAGWSIVSGVLKAGVKVLQGDFKGAWETIKNAFKSAWDSMSGALKSALGGMWNAVSSFVSKAVDRIKKIGSAIAGAVSGKATGGSTHGNYGMYQTNERGQELIRDKFGQTRMATGMDWLSPTDYVMNAGTTNAMTNNNKTDNTKNITVNITVNGANMNENDIARLVRRQLVRL